MGDKNLKNYSTLVLSLTVVGYITIGLFVVSMIFSILIYPIFFSPTNYQSNWLFVLKLYWYIYQFCLFILCLLTLISSIIDLRQKTFWKSIIAGLVLYISWNLYLYFCKHVILYPIF